jgi:hypothetical protein
MRHIIFAALLATPAMVQRIPSNDEVLNFPRIEAPKPLNFATPFDWRDKKIVCQPQIAERSGDLFIYRDIVCRVIGGAAT